MDFNALLTDLIATPLPWIWLTLGLVSFFYYHVRTGWARFTEKVQSQLERWVTNGLILVLSLLGGPILGGGQLWNDIKIRRRATQGGSP